MATIDIHSSGSPNLRGYLARPSGAGPWPGVVVIHELFGLDDVLRRQADRLAAAGYLTLGPDLFSDGGAARCIVRTLRALSRGEGRPLDDIEASLAFVREHADCTGKVGIIGFCMGGGFALLGATRGFDVAADNYGVVPKHPESALAGACPIVASYGSKDHMGRAAATLERTLTQVAVEHDVKEYAGVGHSFLNDEPNGPRVLRPLMRVAHIGPHPEAAADAWSRIEAFFAKHLAA